MGRGQLIHNYTVAAYRCLSSDMVNLVLTILGLAVGLAASLLVALYAINESSYDSFQPEVERSYRLVQHHVPSATDYPLATPRAYQ